MSEEAKLWARYRREKSEESLNDLCLHYMPFVETVASSASKALKHHVTPDEVLGAAYCGLRDAVTKFDAGLQIPFRAYAFRAYAKLRIMGAILDDVRRQDQASRLVRRFQRDMNKARAELEQELLRAPTDREAAERLGISFDEFQSKKAWWFRSSVFGEVVLTQELTNGTVLVSEPPSPDADPFAAVIDNEAFERCLRSLTPAQADVFRLRFLHDMTLADIGKTLDLSESRVCQIVNKCLPVVVDQYQRRFAA